MASAANASSSMDNVLQDLRILDVVARSLALLPDETSRQPVRRRGRRQPAAQREDRWGHLELEACLASGSFGTVYRARDRRLGTNVALKLPRLGLPNRERNARLLDEAHRLGRVSHPGIVRLYGTGTRRQRAGFWMELVEGRTLEEVLRDAGRIDLPEVVRIAGALGSALAAVHAAGLVHGDVKPQNIMIERGTGRVVLIDFGCSLPISVRAPARLSGTPLYLAPELLAGGMPSPASDIYSAGVLLFRLATGELPVTAADLPALAIAQREGRTRRLAAIRPDLPPTFTAAVDRALRFAPGERHLTMEAFTGAL